MKIAKMWASAKALKPFAKMMFPSFYGGVPGEPGFAERRKAGKEEGEIVILTGWLGFIPTHIGLKVDGKIVFKKEIFWDDEGEAMLVSRDTYEAEKRGEL